MVILTVAETGISSVQWSIAAAGTVQVKYGDLTWEQAFTGVDSSGWASVNLLK